MRAGDTWLGEPFGILQFVRAVPPTVSAEGMANARRSAAFSKSNQSSREHTTIGHLVVTFS